VRTEFKLIVSDCIALASNCIRTLPLAPKRTTTFVHIIQCKYFS